MERERERQREKQREKQRERETERGRYHINVVGVVDCAYRSVVVCDKL